MEAQQFRARQYVTTKVGEMESFEPALRLLLHERCCGSCQSTHVSTGSSVKSRHVAVAGRPPKQAAPRNAQQKQASPHTHAGIKYFRQRRRITQVRQPSHNISPSHIYIHIITNTPRTTISLPSSGHPSQTPPSAHPPHSSTPRPASASFQQDIATQHRLGTFLETGSSIHYPQSTVHHLQSAICHIP